MDCAVSGQVLESGQDLYTLSKWAVSSEPVTESSPCSSLLISYVSPVCLALVNSKTVGEL